MKQFELTTIPALQAAYDAGELTPTGLARAIDARIHDVGRDEIWILRLSLDELLGQARRLEERRAAGESLPLFGVPFVVKDNIDVAGLPTTAGCPSYAYRARESAPVVERLLAAGALLIGKMNLDQFATGLVGTRSPYGPCRNYYDPRYVSGGSSSGSAVAVAAGLALFSLGTDTAGSGRVPAAFNNLVGLKPSRGLLSTRGVVPACRSLDCVSIFARACGDARLVFDVARGHDAGDPYSRRHACAPRHVAAAFRFGVPRADQLEFFGDADAERLFHAAVARLEALGGRRVEIDYRPFQETAQLLYGGAWVAEREWAVGDFLATDPPDADPTVASIVRNARGLTARAAFDGLYKLEAAKRQTEPIWLEIDVLLLPTAGTIYTIEQVQADPLQLNSNLGHYTNFVNLLDLAAIALPAGFRPDGLPFGVSLIAPAFMDGQLCELGAKILGEPEDARVIDQAGLLPADEGMIPLAVFGAHMRGLPLNHQLTHKGARLLGRAATSPAYRMFALAGGKVARPALIHAAQGGAAIACEVWELSHEALGRLMVEVAPPLGIGTIELSDGAWIKGFICEPRALDGAQEITSHGGWRAYLESAKTG